MAVETVLVVGDQHVGLIAPDQVRQPLGRLVDGGPPECAGRIVGRPSHHSRVGIAECFQFRHTQRRAARLELGLPHLHDGLPVMTGLARFDPARAVAAAAVGAGHQDGADPLRGSPRQHTTGAGGLIVGMCMDRHQRQGSISHAASISGGCDTDVGPLPHQVHPTDDVYFGHSLGGLFGAYVLLSEPGSFRGYGLGSPSLWWDDCALFAHEQAYATAHADLVADVFVGIGAYENALGDEIHRAWLRLGGAGEGRTEEPDPYDMVADMERLVERLRGRSYPGLRIGSAVLPREFHATAVPMNLSRSLRYLFRAPE